MTKTTFSIAFGITAALLGGCDKKKGEAASTAATTGAAAAAEPGGGPAAFAAWMPKDAAQAWQGAWASRLTLRQTGTMSMAGNPAAVEIQGAKAVAFDGTSEHQLGFEVDSPCTVKFTQPITEGSMKGGNAYHSLMFVLDGDKLIVGSGAGGYRKGKAAVVCSEGSGGGVHILDEAGTCTTWEMKFREWASTPATCTWSQVDGKDVLTIGSGNFAPVLEARGDVLESAQFRQYVAEGYHQRAADYAAAKATVTAQLDAKDPGKLAVAAGGKVGETNTVASLQATFAAAKAATSGAAGDVKGTVVEVAALYLNSNQASASGAAPTYNAILVDSRDNTKITVACRTKEAVTGLKQYDKVIAKGTVGEGFGKAELVDCTLTKAP